MALPGQKLSYYLHGSITVEPAGFLLQGHCKRDYIYLQLWPLLTWVTVFKTTIDSVVNTEIWGKV